MSNEDKNKIVDLGYKDDRDIVEDDFYANYDTKELPIVNTKYKEDLKEDLEAKRAFLQNLKDKQNEVGNDLEEEKGFSKTRNINNAGSSIIITILVTAVVATAGILTAILMLK